MKIKLISIYVTDPIEAFRFYTEILGFKEHLFMPEASLAIVVSPESPEGTALLLEPNSHPAAKIYQKAIYQDNLPMLVLGSDDVQKDYDALLKKGVKFRQIPTKTEWGTTAIFEDTCGNLIQIHQD